jgi:hypothetical protein
MSKCMFSTVFTGCRKPPSQQQALKYENHVRTFTPRYMTNPPLTNTTFGYNLEDYKVN